MQLTEIRIAGFGGQGVILSAMVIGKAAAIFEGGYATLTQSFGPEARGGASAAQVILSDRPVLYPYVARPDVLVVMSQEAYTRFSPDVKDGGVLIVEEDMVRVSDVHSGVRIFSVPATRLAEEIGRRMVLNIVMVGFFASVMGMPSARSLRLAIADSVPPATVDLNRRAFDKGYEYGLAKIRRADEEDPAPQELESLP